MFGGKKFGLVGAFKALVSKPDMSRDGATTGLAFLEAMGVRVTVVPEATKKISKFETSQKEAKDGISTAETSLDDIEREGRITVTTLTGEAGEKSATTWTRATERAGQMKAKGVARVNKLRDKLNAKISATEDNTSRKAEQIYRAANDAEQRINEKVEAKIADTEQRTKDSIEATRTMIDELRAEITKRDADLITLRRVERLFA